MKKADKEKAESCERLRKWLAPGDMVHCILRHRAASGMLRIVQLVKVEGADVVYLGHNAATAAGFAYDQKREGLRLQGCGMDMGFHAVYNLGAALWPDGYGCAGKNCPSNDHSNGDRDYTPHGPTDETGVAENRDPGPGEKADGLVRHWHADGGYALRSHWI